MSKEGKLRVQLKTQTQLTSHPWYAAQKWLGTIQTKAVARVNYSATASIAPKKKIQTYLKDAVQISGSCRSSTLLFLYFLYCKYFYSPPQHHLKSKLSTEEDFFISKNNKGENMRNE